MKFNCDFFNHDWTLLGERKELYGQTRREEGFSSNHYFLMPNRWIKLRYLSWSVFLR